MKYDWNKNNLLIFEDKIIINKINMQFSNKIDKMNI